MSGFSRFSETNTEHLWITHSNAQQVSYSGGKKYFILFWFCRFVHFKRNWLSSCEHWKIEHLRIQIYKWSIFCFFTHYWHHHVSDSDLSHMEMSLFGTGEASSHSSFSAVLSKLLTAVIRSDVRWGRWPQLCVSMCIHTWLDAVSGAQAGASGNDGSVWHGRDRSEDPQTRQSQDQR